MLLAIVSGIYLPTKVCQYIWATDTKDCTFFFFCNRYFSGVIKSRMAFEAKKIKFIDRTNFVLYPICASFDHIV